MSVLGPWNLLAQAPDGPGQNPEGNTGALKPQVTTGGSYDAHSGNATRIVNDLQVPGALGKYGLDFTRYWNSVHPEDEEQAAVWGVDFGDTGWSHSWKWSAIRYDDSPEDGEPRIWVTSIVITFPDGHATKYKISRSNNPPWPDGRCGPPYIPEHGEENWPSPGPKVHDHLAKMHREGTDFWLYRADGGSVHFTAGPGGYQATEVYDRNGFKTILIYEGEFLKQVKQEDGNRWLDISWKSFDGQPVIKKVETGGAAAGNQVVNYQYSRFPGAIVLSSVVYADTPAVGQTSMAMYTYGAAAQSLDPLLEQADDPHYSGAMTKIRYDYRGLPCPPPLPHPSPTADPHNFTAESINRERSGETGVTVSEFQGACGDGVRKDFNGIGGERRLYYGNSANDPVNPYWIQGFNLAKITDFGPPGADFSALPALRGTQSQPAHIWDGLLHRTDFTYDNSGGAAQVLHSVDGSSIFYDRVNEGASEGPDTTRIRNPYHHWLFSNKDENGNVTTYKRDPRRRVTEIKYYKGLAQGNPVAMESYTYNNWNQVETHTLPSGAVQHYEYNGLNQLWKEWNDVDGEADYTYYQYDSLGRVALVQNALARARGKPFSAQMEYNGRHQVVKLTYPATDSGNSPFISYEYDKYGNCTAIIDELGHRKDYTYDSYRRCTSLTEQVNNFVAGCTYVVSRRWDWIYDRVIKYEGQPRQYSYPASAHTSKEWRAQVEPAFNSVGERRVTARTFDVNDRIVYEQTGVIQPLGPIGPENAWHNGPDTETHYFTYDDNGQKKTYQDPLGRITTYRYDGRNRLHETEEPKRLDQSVNPVTKTDYDVAGNKLMTTFPDNRTQQWGEYDAFGQAWKFTDERSHVTDLVYWWGPMKKLYKVTTHREMGGGWEDQPTTFSYDFMGRLKQTLFPDGSDEFSSYKFGQLDTFKTRRNQTKTIHYDARGREDNHTWGNGAAPGITRVWDNANRLSQISNEFSTIDYQYDDAGLMRTEKTTVTDSGGPREVRYCRFPSGEVSQITYPNGTQVSPNYNARGQLKDVGWGTGATSFVYRPDGKPNVQVRTNGVSTNYGYDERGITSSVQHRNDAAGHDLAKRDYWRDDRDRILAWKKGTDNSINPMEDGRGDRYEYDEEGQLTKASYQAMFTPPELIASQAKRSDIFIYDAMGNRMGSNYVANRGWMNFPMRDNKLNQYLAWVPYSAIYHDDNMPPPTPAPTPPAPPFQWVYPGNGVAMQDGYITASYNALNQPVAIWSPANPTQYLWYGHDPLGRCVKRWTGDANHLPVGSNPTTYFYYDGWNLIQEGSSASNPARVYVHGGRVDEIVASWAGEWRHHHYDARGHCIMLTDTDGVIREQYDYDAFGYPYFYTGTGNKLSSNNQWGNRFLFTGREWLKELKVYDYRHRIYQPELGRFLQPDPKQFESGDYNLYRYCRNDPVNKNDPTGLQEIFFMGEVPGVARPQLPPELVGEAIRLNQPKNSIELPDGRRVDLAGRSHYDPKLGREIETPHVHEPRPAFKPPYDEKFPNPGVERVPRPATPKDIQDAIKHLLERIKEFLFKPLPEDKKKLDST